MRSQFVSPINIISFSSISSCFGVSLRFSNDSSSAPQVGGRYQQTIRKGFAWVGKISTDGSSKFLPFNFMVGYGKLSFTYKATLPPFTSRSFRKMD